MLLSLRYFFLSLQTFSNELACLFIVFSSDKGKDHICQPNTKSWQDMSSRWNRRSSSECSRNTQHFSLSSTKSIPVSLSVCFYIFLVILNVLTIINSIQCVIYYFFFFQQETALSINQEETSKIEPLLSEKSPCVIARPLQWSVHI